MGILLHYLTCILLFYNISLAFPVFFAFLQLMLLQHIILHQIDTVFSILAEFPQKTTLNSLNFHYFIRFSKLFSYS